VSRGILIPPSTTLASWGEEPGPGQQELASEVRHRYPIVFCDLESSPLLLLPRVGFVPQTVSLRILKPVFLCYRLAFDNKSVVGRYNTIDGLDGLSECTGYTIATRRIALAEVKSIKEYLTKYHRIPYIAVSRLRVRNRLSSDSLHFLHKLEPGVSTRYRGFFIEVDAQAESLGEALDAVSYSAGLVSSSMEARITTVILFARNGLFMNASQPAPLSRDGRYTIARIGCSEWPSALLLVVDWDDDLLSPRESMVSLFDALALRWVEPLW
jgi:hypothetical protein